jgi:hypothetical protein
MSARFDEKGIFFENIIVLLYLLLYSVKMGFHPCFRDQLQSIFTSTCLKNEYAIPS